MAASVNQWTKVLDLIRDQVNSANFRTWFAQTSCEKMTDGGLLISVPSAFIKQQISTKYMAILQPAVQEVFGKNLILDFKINSQKTIKNLEDFTEPELNFSAPTINNSNNGLNPRYTLETFMVGLSNQLAFAAAQAVVQNPGISYNPLFVYGGTGVGKTHLMHTIGHSLLNKNPYLKIIYCSSEKFMNDFVQGIQTKRMGDFRAKYRACDLLLIDDIQFISGRDAIQEEFFHTFNDLQSKNTQIVLTSDRPPNDIQKLESRLQSRFQGGLMVDIQLPDFDTRVAILKAKCTERGEDIPQNYLSLIAESCSTNARELEGKLIQIIQITKLANQPLTEEAVKKVLGKSIPQPVGQKLDFKRVISTTTQYFSVKLSDLTGAKRNKGIVLPRQLVMYFLYEECKLPYEKIGDILGGRDHTTIMHGVEKIQQAINRDREVQRMVIELKQSLQNPS